MGAGELSGGGGGERGAIPLLAPCFVLWVSREEGGGGCVCDVMVAVIPRVSRGLLECRFSLLPYIFLPQNLRNVDNETPLIIKKCTLRPFKISIIKCLIRSLR